MATSKDQLERDFRKGRGSASNRSGRFEAYQCEAVDDGWDREAEDPPPLRTTVTIENARSIITRNRSPDLPFDRSINPYRGCEHGCAYCFARPSHAFLGLSPGLDFESRLFAKPDAPALLAKTLAKPGYRPEVIAIGTNTDPYQPIERRWKIMRGVLEVLADFRHPVAITTKSALVTRDIDLLKPLAAHDLVKVYLSVTTLDRKLANSLEPRAPTPERRLAAIRALTEAGIPAGVMVAPIIPGLTDHEINQILAMAAQVGARECGYVLLRLPLEITDLFQEWLALHRPDRARRVMALVRETRGGADYDSRFARRLRGQGPYAEMIRQSFNSAAKRHRFNQRRLPLATRHFRVPEAHEVARKQAPNRATNSDQYQLL